jgi:hypothetical protein
MSVATEVYDAVKNRVETIYSSSIYRKLQNPYVVEDNSDLTLRRGYGFYMGPAFNTERNLSCNLSMQRDIVISNTIVHRGSDKDIDIRAIARFRQGT